ncbi:MAG: hypothetical protein HC836_20395 [Richelia sp. RM2_1_2]|nr:hypothetical protein [Richelia sp. SM1_7_0]NJN10643.1 hypothetical protein [Richelia sp. RM1_1_1]NJO60535.1 hypothetical protein [Richelia sp. RM2_1_2]
MTQKLESSLIKKVLQNPILLQKLTDKVYELMLEDLHKQREIRGSYR